MNAIIEFSAPLTSVNPARQRTSRLLSPALLVTLYALAMAWVEAAVVFYLRTMIGRLDPFQANPLPVSTGLGLPEIAGEAATLFMLLAAIYGACELAGWREHTTFISGTAASADAGINSSVTFGLIYMLACFGFGLGTPVLLLAAALLVLCKRFGPTPARAERRARPSP